MIGQIIFIIILVAAIYLFSKNVRKIRRNILLGRDTDRSDRPAEGSPAAEPGLYPGRCAEPAGKY